MTAAFAVPLVNHNLIMYCFCDSSRTVYSGNYLHPYMMHWISTYAPSALPMYIDTTRSYTNDLQVSDTIPNPTLVTHLWALCAFYLFYRGTLSQEPNVKFPYLALCPRKLSTGDELGRPVGSIFTQGLSTISHLGIIARHHCGCRC